MTQCNDNHIRVLVLEKSRILRTGLCLLFNESPDIEVVGETTFPEEAAGPLLAKNPSLIVLDMDLPDNGGVRTLQMIRKKAPSISTLVMLSRLDEQQIMEALRYGARGYCLKDTSGKRLLSALRFIHSGGVWLDPDIADNVLTAYNCFYPLNENGNNAKNHKLSEREQEVLFLMVEGKNNQEISEALNLSVSTIKSHLRQIFKKLKTRDRIQTAVKAIRKHLVDL